MKNIFLYIIVFIALGVSLISFVGTARHEKYFTTLFRHAVEQERRIDTLENEIIESLLRPTGGNRQ